MAEELGVGLGRAATQDLESSVDGSELAGGEHREGVGAEALQQQPEQVASSTARCGIGLAL